MADSFITQCPHCQVKFKLTESQLNAAKGSVRCGACLNIFNAKENLAANQPAKAKEPVKKPIPKPEAPLEKELEFSSDDSSANLFEFDEEPQSEIQDDISESLFADLEADDSNDDLESQDEFELPSDLESGYSSDDDDMNSLFSDSEDGIGDISEPEPENTDDQILDEFSNLDAPNSIFDESQNQPEQKQSEENSDEDFVFGVDETNELEIDESFLDFDENSTDAFTDDAIIAEEDLTEKVGNSDDDLSDESWTQALLDDDKPKENKAVFESKNLGENKKETTAIDPHKNTSFYGEELPNDFDNDVTQVANTEKPKENVKKSVNKIEQDTQELDDLLEKTGSGILTFISWFFMCVILSAALIGQYIYFNFDYLSQSKWNKELTQVCEYIGCKVSNTSTVDKGIFISKSIYNKEDNGVNVIFILSNPESKLIDYPDLLVKVYDKNNLLLGDQIFKPEEYLPSQIKNENQIRPNVNVKASVMIKDLGSKVAKRELLLIPNS